MMDAPIHTHTGVSTGTCVGDPAQLQRQRLLWRDKQYSNVTLHNQYKIINISVTTIIKYDIYNREQDARLRSDSSTSFSLQDFQCPPAFLLQTKTIKTA